MMIDKEIHKELLLQIINQATFKGEIVEVVAELKDAIGNATVSSPINPT